MITINLLPKERRRGRGIALPKPVLYAGLGAVVVLGAMAVYWFHLDGQLQQLQESVTRNRQELKKYEAEIKRVDQFRADKKRLEERLRIVERLAAEQHGPVRLLDQISQVLPEEVWLTALNKTRDRLSLSGYAFSNFGIANFMTELGKLQPAIRNVELVVSEKAVVERVPVERFEITATTGS
jgi:type IV pilus assembly protein PilN